MRASTSKPPAPFEVLQTVAEVRSWRKEKLLQGHTVGFVPTMGCLHQGHLNLLRHSLSATDHTIASIFVNPAQFAPHEDLATYPRTLAEDINKLGGLSVAPGSMQIPTDFAAPPTWASEPVPSLTGGERRVSALFLPSVETLYPSGIVQDVSQQRGTFVEVKGYSHQMEGQTRPTFFRGVATIVLKLFNIIQPDKAFFGQKDIQQCIVLRQMLRDLHLAHPSSPQDLVAIPTSRNPESGLALSSRNAYLSPAEREFAPSLFQGLMAGKQAFERAAATGGAALASAICEAAAKVVHEAAATAQTKDVKLKLDFVSLNDPITLEAMTSIRKGMGGGILSGAMYCGSTRLIDNIVLDLDLNA